MGPTRSSGSLEEKREKREREESMDICRDLLLDLCECLAHTKCVTHEKRTLKDCLKDTTASSECQHLRLEYFQCKRGALDMRNRFRGNARSDKKG